MKKSNKINRMCDHIGCSRPGEYKAPVDNTLSSSYWFCLEHVREYNRNWNFYRDYTEEQMEEAIRADTIWGRATRTFGAPQHRDKPFLLPAGVAKALGSLGLRFPYTKQELRAKYKELAKKFHPDATAGDKRLEEKFKNLTQNYKILLEFL